MSTTTTQRITFAAKLRWVKKQPLEKTNVNNFEAVRLMCNAIMLEQQGKLNEADGFEMKAMRELEAEQRDYLRGIAHVPNSDPAFSMSPSRAGLL